MYKITITVFTPSILYAQKKFNSIKIEYLIHKNILGTSTFLDRLFLQAKTI